MVDIVYDKISVPFAIMILGPSGTGKSTLAKEILINSGDVCDHTLSRLVFCYGGADQPIYDEIRQAIPNNIFIDGWNESLMNNPDLYSSGDETVRTVLVVDDLVFQCCNSPFLVDCFVKYRSRWNLSIIFISQVIFEPSLKGLRTISRNATGMFLLRNQRGRQALKCLATQMGIDDLKLFLKVFIEATTTNGYLYCDMMGWLSNELMRFRSGLLPGESAVCYEM